MEFNSNSPEVLEYRKKYEHTKLAYTLKTGKKLRRKQFHKTITYLSNLYMHYRYANCVQACSPGICRSTLVFKRDDNINQKELLLESFNKFVPDSKFVKSHLIKQEYPTSLNEISFIFEYESSKIDWGYMDFELVTFHKDNIMFNNILKVPMIKEMRRLHID